MTTSLLPPPTRLTPACAGRFELYDAVTDALDSDPQAQQPATRALVSQARAVCARCPLATQDACLSRAMAAEVGEPRWGLWSGLTAEDRAALAAASFLLEPPTGGRHGRSCTTSGRCDCDEGRRAHAEYVKQWRAQSPSHTQRKAQDVEQLTMWEAE